MVRKVTVSKARRARRAGSKLAQEEIMRTILALEAIRPKTPKANKVLSLLHSWLVDESGYDEETWPGLRKALDQERHRSGARRLFQ